MSTTAFKKKEAYLTFLLAQSRLAGTTSCPYVPALLLYSTVWEYLTLPHERIFGKRGKEVKKYNSILHQLPRPQIFPGPRILHSFGLHSYAEGVQQTRHLSMVKFIYSIRHARNPNSYITIHVYTTMPRLPPRDGEHVLSINQRIKGLRSHYMKEIK